MDRLTLPEYNLLMEAAQLKQIDLDYRNHLQAWLNFVVQAKKKAGKNKQKPIYRKFNQFYDYKKALNEHKTKEKSKMGKFSGVGKFLNKKGE